MTMTMTHTQTMINMQQGRVKHFTDEILRMYTILESETVDTESFNAILDNVADLERMRDNAYKMLEFYLIRQGKEEMSKGN